VTDTLALQDPPEDVPLLAGAMLGNQDGDRLTYGLRRGIA
jgi:hypothetical protein